MCTFSNKVYPLICWVCLKGFNKVKISESGAAMELSNVHLSIGNNDIISEINWSIMPKERWALVGRNGAGNQLPSANYFSDVINKLKCLKKTQENQRC